jgi:hypothetical protein
LNHNTCKAETERFFDFEEALSRMKAGGFIQHKDDTSGELIFCGGPDRQMNFAGRYVFCDEVKGLLHKPERIFCVDDRGIINKPAIPSALLLEKCWRACPEPDSWGWALAEMKKGRRVTCSRLGPTGEAYLIKYRTQLDHMPSAVHVTMGVLRMLNATDFTPFPVVDSLIGIRVLNDDDKKAKDWRLK